MGLSKAMTALHLVRRAQLPSLCLWRLHMGWTEAAVQLVIM